MNKDVTTVAQAGEYRPASRRKRFVYGAVPREAQNACVTNFRDSVWARDTEDFGAGQDEICGVGFVKSESNASPTLILSSDV